MSGLLNTPWTVKLIVTPGVEPTVEQLNLGDICLNVADGRFFFRLMNGSITELVSTEFVGTEFLTRLQADQLYQAAGAATSRSFSVTQGSLIGQFAILTHGLGTTAIDVTISDSSGPVNLPWKAVSEQLVEVDFTGLLPLANPFFVLVER